MSSHDEKLLKELRLLMDSNQFTSVRRVQHAENLRGEVTANWLNSFMDRMHKTELDKSSNLINKKTGQPHTVDSLVSELRERVQLDSILKSSTQDIPLSTKNASDELIAKVNTVIEGFLSSHRGHADDQAILYYLRDMFGDDNINKISDKIIEKIKKLRAENPSSFINDTSLGDAAFSEPLKLDESDLSEDIFQNIQEGLSKR